MINAKEARKKSMHIMDEMAEKFIMCAVEKGDRCCIIHKVSPQFLEELKKLGYIVTRYSNPVENVYKIAW